MSWKCSTLHLPLQKVEYTVFNVFHYLLFTMVLSQGITVYRTPWSINWEFQGQDEEKYNS